MLPEQPLPVFFDKASAVRTMLQEDNEDARIRLVQVEYDDSATLPETFYAAGKLEDNGVKIYGLFTSREATLNFIAEAACEGCLKVLPACLGVLSTMMQGYVH